MNKQLYDPFYEVKVNVYHKYDAKLADKAGINPKDSATIITEKVGKEFSIWFNKKDLNTIVHEVTHLVDDVLEYRGVKDPEARAYYMAGWVILIKSALK